MLKMVTSYSIFLLIILVLFIFLYRSTINNARDSYDQQNETTLISNAELFESDLNNHGSLLQTASAERHFPESHEL